MAVQSDAKVNITDFKEKIVEAGIHDPGIANSYEFFSYKFQTKEEFYDVCNKTKTTWTDNETGLIYDDKHFYLGIAPMSFQPQEITHILLEFEKQFNRSICTSSVKEIVDFGIETNLLTEEVNEEKTIIKNEILSYANNIPINREPDVSIHGEMLRKRGSSVCLGKDLGHYGVGRIWITVNTPEGDSVLSISNVENGRVVDDLKYMLHERFIEDVSRVEYANVNFGEWAVVDEYFIKLLKDFDNMYENKYGVSPHSDNDIMKKVKEKSGQADRVSSDGDMTVMERLAKRFKENNDKLKEACEKTSEEITDSLNAFGGKKAPRVIKQALAPVYTSNVERKKNLLEIQPLLEKFEKATTSAEQQNYKDKIQDVLAKDANLEQAVDQGKERARDFLKNRSKSEQNFNLEDALNADAEATHSMPSKFGQTYDDGPEQ